MHTPKIKQLKVKHVCQKQLGKLTGSYQMYETKQKIELVANFFYYFLRIQQTKDVNEKQLIYKE